MSVPKTFAQKGSLSAYQVAQFRRDGFITVRQVFTPPEIAEIRDTFMEMARNGPVEGLSEGKQELNRGGTAQYAPSDPLSFYPRMMHPHNHLDKPVGPLSMKYMLHSKLEGILLALLAQEPLAVQSMFYFKPPQSRGQALHQDNFYLRVKPGTCVAAWVAIDDADEENGGIRCVANTQNHPIQCPEQSNLAESFTTEHVTPPKGSRVEVVPLKAGDVLFFNGNVIHGSGPNRSKTRFRRAFIFHYVPLSAAELSSWYKTPFRFNRQVVSIAAAAGGGPCGTADRGQQAPH
jgi:ectoine hydroxylase-related dioxygenase (phytanoyl-CoA dioxygenase family)